MATIHIPLRRPAQALPFIVAGSALASVAAWSNGRSVVAAAAVLPGVAAVVAGSRPWKDLARDDRQPPPLHPARHDLGSGVLHRSAFEDRMRRRDGWAAVALLVADAKADIGWISRVVAVLPAGAEPGLLGDGRLGMLLDAESDIARTVTAIRAAAGQNVRVGLSIGGFDEEVVEALRAAEGQCRIGARGTRSATENVIDLRPMNTSIDLETDLRNAIDAGDLEVRFQPVLDLTRGTVLSMEALARWTHDLKGPISPDVFIPLAERAGSIDSLTGFVLDRALAACAVWHGEGNPIRVAVNVSAQTLASTAFPDVIGEALIRHRLDARWLTLEITEGHAVPDEPITNQVLAELRRLGVRLAMDDFGTGHSSFAQLLRLEVDEVKIDRSFVSRCLDSVTEAAVVRSVIELGQRLGLDVVAEGVEDVEVRDHLAALGCDSMQGYLASYPLSAPEAAAWLVARQVAPST